MLQQAGRKHVYAGLGDARPLMRYAPRCLKAGKRSTLSYIENLSGVWIFVFSLTSDGKYMDFERALVSYVQLLVAGCTTLPPHAACKISSTVNGFNYTFYYYYTQVMKHELQIALAIS